MARTFTKFSSLENQSSASQEAFGLRNHETAAYWPNFVTEYHPIGSRLYDFRVKNAFRKYGGQEGRLFIFPDKVNLESAKDRLIAMQYDDDDFLKVSDRELVVFPHKSFSIETHTNIVSGVIANYVGEEIVQLR